MKIKKMKITIKRAAGTVVVLTLIMGLFFAVGFTNETQTKETNKNAPTETIFKFIGENIEEAKLIEFWVISDVSSLSCEPIGLLPCYVSITDGDMDDLEAWLDSKIDDDAVLADADAQRN